jgi:hypothetical protein
VFREDERTYISIAASASSLAADMLDWGCSLVSRRKVPFAHLGAATHDWARMVISRWLLYSQVLRLAVFRSLFGCSCGLRHDKRCLQPHR